MNCGIWGDARDAPVWGPEFPARPIAGIYQDIQTAREIDFVLNTVLVLGGDDVNAPGTKRNEVYFY